MFVLVDVANMASWRQMFCFKCINQHITPGVCLPAGVKQSAMNVPKES